MWRTVRLIIGFEGTRYKGWQSQKKGNTVQEIFEKYLKKILKEPISLISSSRTDSGVHAFGLTAHFKTKNPLPDRSIKGALNFYLPHDIAVYSAKTVDAAFHAQHHAKSKIYRYDIWNSGSKPIFQAPYVLWYQGKLDLRLMKKAARFFVGTHDFNAFRQTGEDVPRSTVRTIKRMSVIKKKEMIRIEIEGDGFLRSMVRIIVGTLISVGRGKLPSESIPQIIHSKDRSQAGPTAKALGLTLVKVKY